MAKLPLQPYAPRVTNNGSIVLRTGQIYDYLYDFVVRTLPNPTAKPQSLTKWRVENTYAAPVHITSRGKVLFCESHNVPETRYVNAPNELPDGYGHIRQISEPVPVDEREVVLYCSPGKLTELAYPIVIKL